MMRDPGECTIALPVQPQENRPRAWSERKETASEAFLRIYGPRADVTSERYTAFINGWNAARGRA